MRRRDLDGGPSGHVRRAVRLPLSSRALHACATALVLVLAVTMRLPLIRRELPAVYHPDEPTNVRIFATMLVDHDPNPHFFGYPSLMFYVHALPYLPRQLLNLPFRFLPSVSPDEIVTQGVGITQVDDPTPFLIGRSITVLFALAGVLLVYATVCRLTGSRALACFSAALLALSPTFFENSVYITPDVPAASAVALVVYLAVRARDDPRTLSYVFAGASVGLAMSFKYNALLTAVVVVVVAFQNRTTWWIDKRAFWAGPAALAAFLLTTPFALLDPVTFARGAGFEIMHYKTGHLGMQGGAPAFYASYLWSTETPLVLAAGLAVLLLLRRSRDVALLLAFPVIYALSIADLEVRNSRTAILLIPPLCVLCGVVVAELRTVLGRPGRLGPRGHVLLVAVSALVAVGVLASSAARDDQLRERLLAPDNRRSAQEWVYQHVSEHATVLDEAYAPWLDPRRYLVRSVFTLDTADPGSFSGPDAVDYVVSTDMRARFEADPGRYRSELGRYEFAYDHMDVVATFDQLSGPSVTIFQTRLSRS